MGLKRFKTDWRLRLWISLVLFVVPWFVPTIGRDFAMAPVAHWIVLFTHPNHIGETLAYIGTFSLLFGVTAITIGWVLQCLIVMIRDRGLRG